LFGFADFVPDPSLVVANTLVLTAAIIAHFLFPPY
jgi:hypothetical protein